MGSIITLLIVSLFLQSCLDFVDIDAGEDGLFFYLHNYTEESYEGATTYIGAVKDEVFIPVDFTQSNVDIMALDISSIENVYEDGEKYIVSRFRNDKEYHIYGWQIDYDKLKEILNEYTLRFRFSDGRERTFLNKEKYMMRLGLA